MSVFTDVRDNTEAAATGGLVGGGPIKDTVSKFVNDAPNKLGFGTKKQDDLAAQMSANSDKQYNDTEGVLGNMKTADSNYISSSKTANDAYKAARDPAIYQWQIQNDALTQKSQDQATNAHNTYTNDILPQQKDNMQNAMTLKQAQDPNNSVASGVRNLYNKQAQGAQQRGLTDYGALAGLGAQATQGMVGSGNALSGGQLASIQGANMGQAGQAFANAQNYANNLRSQGVVAGQNQSNWAYGQGQNAGQTYQNSVGNDVNQQAGFRGEQGNLANQRMGVDVGHAREDYNYDQSVADTQQGFGQAEGNRELGAIGQRYGGQNAALGVQANAAGAQQAGKIGVFGSLIGAAGSAAGMMGKAGGAATGATSSPGDGSPGSNDSGSSDSGAGTPGGPGNSVNGGDSGGGSTGAEQPLNGGYLTGGQNPYGPGVGGYMQGNQGGYQPQRRRYA